MAASHRVGILGASGYGGAGLIERLSRHGGVELVAVGSRQYAGQSVDACWPHLAGLFPGLTFSSEDEVIEASDVVFCATPHGATAPLVKRALDAGKRVIDLSADFRLPAASYEEWYGGPHPHPELLHEAVYGLVELHRDELPGRRLIASPGCNATAASLALAPLAAAGLLGSSAVVSVLTGVSGAGRGSSAMLHYPEMNGNSRAYKPSGTHRHTAEIEATVGRVKRGGKRLRTHDDFEPYTVSFTPHILPMKRGILATCATRTKDAELTDDRIVLSAGALLPIVPRVLTATWQRHLQAAIRRRLSIAEAGGGQLGVVGFADLVGFTALSQQVGGDELAAIVEQFEQLAFDVVTANGGRVVKMIGDEVMFTVDSPVAAAEIGLALAEGTRGADELSDLRVGLAYGSLLEREGDLYGPVVNIASRITAIAFPGSIVVGQAMHDHLEGRHEYRLRSMRPR